MLTRFYQRYGRLILWFAALSFPILLIRAEGLPSNNDIETWLPKGAPARESYEQFKRDFGVEEVIVVGIDPAAADERLLEALADRLDSLPGIRRAWTPQRLENVMGELGVTPEEARKRLSGLVIADKGQLVGLVASLSPEGLKNRGGTVAAVRAELEYCQLRGDSVCLTGAPVIVTELDALGSQKSSRKFFMLTLLISLSLLYYSTGHLKMSLSLVGVTLWTIYITKTIIAVCGGEMNFILGALSVMVMIFTLSVSIHLLGYYGDALDEGGDDPLGHSLIESLKPCVLATATTLVGLISLNVSNILPVAQFGYAAALGSVIACVTGLGVTPALLVIWPDCRLRPGRGRDFEAWGRGVVRYKTPILVTAAICLFITSFGLMRLKADIDPVEFLPKGSKVVSDLRRIERELTHVDSIEAVVDFRGSELTFLQKLEVVRGLEQRIAGNGYVRHTMSLATFFPAVLPDNPLELMGMLKQAKSQSGASDLLAEGDRLWRISARIATPKGTTNKEVLAELTAAVNGSPAPIHFTGVTPLLEEAQNEIFSGFWQSFLTAFLIISVVMIVSLWSLPAGVVAMIPNVIPIWIVFGIVGFMGMNVDIGMMMTGSIALGISVDCTFHFLVRYKQHYKAGKTSAEAAQMALAHTAEPMLDSTIVASLGMLALGLSNFAPTARFGYLMAAQMTASLVGELILLPALLCLRPGRKGEISTPETTEVPAAHQRKSVETSERVA